VKIGLAYDLKSSAVGATGGPDDAAEELDSPETIDALASEFKRLGHDPVYLGGGDEFLDNIRRSAVDFVFNIAEGKGVCRSREAQVPCVLEMLGIPYSGSDPLTLSLCLDKPWAKRVVQTAGVATPAYYLVAGPEDLASAGALSYPVIVKPAFEGSSKGIRLTSRVERKEQLSQAVDAVIGPYHQPALVEEFIPGREVTVGIVGNNPPRVVGAMEVVPLNGTGNGFMYSLEVKRDWRRQVSYRCPPDLPGECVTRIEQAALTVFHALQCRDMARIDFRIDGLNRPFFLEANPLPGLSPVPSDLPIMAGLVGWTYSQLIENILHAALQRCRLLEVAERHAHHTLV
jgi:D-alanine-D-alanine ligase